MRAINLKTNHLTAPVGIDAGPLFLSWQCADGVRQNARACIFVVVVARPACAKPPMKFN